MLGKITILSGQVLTRPEYCQYRASLHAGATEELVRAAMRRCELGESEFPEDFPESLYSMAEQICGDISRSGGDVDPIVEEQVHQHTHTATETPAEASQPESEPEIPELETPSLEIISKSTETEIVEAARNARLDNAYTILREKFVFAEDMSTAVPKLDAVISPQDYGTLCGFGLDMGRRSLWLAGGAILALQRMGHEGAVEIIADEAGFSYSHASNLARVCDRIPPEQRHGLLPTVAQEIATRQYSTDPAKNQEIILGLVEQARTEKWNCAQSRSHAALAQGKDVPITDYSGGKKKLKERVEELEEALQQIAFIQDSMTGGDWDEIELARSIARKVLGIEKEEPVKEPLPAAA